MSVAGLSFPDIASGRSSGDFSADREGLCRLRAERAALQLVLPRHLRPRREKIFGPAPSHLLDGNAKARVWAAAAAYNSANRKPGWLERQDAGGVQLPLVKPTRRRASWICRLHNVARRIGTSTP